MLALLDLKGCLVTIDAAGCQSTITALVREAEGDYVLALKANQKTLHAEVKEYAEQARAQGDYYSETDGGHGRVEVRRCWAFGDVAWLPQAQRWSGLTSVALVESERHIGERVTRERRYFVSSLPPDAERILRAVRSHWGIENSQHWVLDMVFSEDQSRVRQRRAATNLATLRRLALNVLSQDKLRDSTRGKRQRAGWDEKYLAQLVGFQMR